MNESYFANIFKKHTGMTPNEFKNFSSSSGEIIVQ